MLIATALPDVERATKSEVGESGGCYTGKQDLHPGDVLNDVLAK